MKVILLAGGSGERLWPVSRKAFPKQFFQIDQTESLLFKSVKRNLSLVRPQELFIVTHKDYYHEILKEVPMIPKENIICEPEKKNTAPAIALAIQYINPSPEETLLVVPSDHIISPLDKYVNYVKEAENYAQEGFIVIFGVRPNRPETGYGYIKASSSTVECFVEKPDRQSALEYLLAGSYYWNAGIFAFTKKTIEREFQTYAPQILASSYEDICEHFSHMPSISIDYAIIEKSKKVRMVNFDLSWSDVGSWEQVYDLLQKDEKGNASFGPTKMMDTTNTLVFAKKRLLSTIGVDNLIIIETEDALLVADKKQGQKVKDLVKSLREEGKKESDEHPKVNRPWGSYTVLEEEGRYKIKKIEVKPNEKLSLQLHYHRSEHWVVVKGTAKVSIGDQETIVKEGESIFVPKTAIHRVENPGKVSLEIIEVQVGEYLGEDDILRLKDIYGRLKESEAFQL